MSGGVGPRVPKDDFMRALGLEPSDARHEGYYRAMRDEAITVYTQLNASKSNLTDEKQGDNSIRPPYFWHHISRERQQWAIVQTWQNAAVGTIQRTLFDRGATSGEHAPNWVTLWLLYSVFRSRDIRNNRNRRNGDSGGSIGSTEKTLYDPARNVHRPR